APYTSRFEWGGALLLADEGRVVVDAAHAIDRLVVGPALAGALHDAFGDLARAVAFRLVVGADHYRRAVDLQAPFVRVAGAGKPDLELAALDRDRLDLRAGQRPDLVTAGKQTCHRKTDHPELHHSRPPDRVR